MWPIVFECMNLQVHTKSLNFFGLTTIPPVQVTCCNDRVAIGDKLFASLIVYLAADGGVESSMSRVLSLSDGAAGGSRISRSCTYVSTGVSSFLTRCL